MSASGDVESITVFDTISRLVDKSLVLADDPDGASLYRLLETIRAFADPAGPCGRRARRRCATPTPPGGAASSNGSVSPAPPTTSSRSSTPTTTISSPPRRGPPNVTSTLVCACCGRSPAPSRGPDAPATPCLPSTCCWRPPSSSNTRGHWLRAALSAAIPVLGFDGPASVRRAAHPLRVASGRPATTRTARRIARWLLGMSIATDRELVRLSARARPALCRSRWPRSGWPSTPRSTNPTRPATRCMTPTPPLPPTAAAYIRDFARAAHGFQELIFGHLDDVIDAGQAAHHRHRPDRSSSTASGCSSSADCSAATPRPSTRRLDAAQRAVARQVPGFRSARRDRDLLPRLAQRRTALSTAPYAPIDVDPWLVPRDAVDRGEPLGREGRRRVAARRVAPPSKRWPTPSCGLVEGSEDHWHEALRLADEHGLRLIAVDALEALGAAAAAATDSSAEALRLLAAAERLRHETGYRWRFAGEQTHVRRCAAGGASGPRRRGRRRLGGRAQPRPRARQSLRRRARGERGRPRHGWASLTPTEQRVVDLVVRGLTNPEIAERLLMARGTVKTHLEHVFAKTGYRNRAELAAAVIEHKHDGP